MLAKRAIATEYKIHSTHVTGWVMKSLVKAFLTDLFCKLYRKMRMENLESSTLATKV